MFQTCPAKYDLRIRQHWSSRKKSAALGFGGALHEGLAAWYRTKDRAKAITAIHDSWPQNVPIDDWRTKEKCISVFMAYVKEYPEETFQVVGAPDNPMVECTFTLDTGLCLDDGEAIEYGGIFDGLVEYSGSVYVLEHKSTSQLGSYYFDQFKPNNQVTGYVWAAGLLSGKRVGGAIINALGIYKSSPTKLERQITTRSDASIMEWLTNLKNSCEMIKERERTGYWPMYTGSCTMYGKCEYHDVHLLATENERSRMLEQNYVREAWDHELREGVKDE
jgi:hypothetical protein